MTAKPQALKDRQVIPSDITIPKRPEVTDVIFVMHGIRDEGFWTQKIARRVTAQAREQTIAQASKQEKVVASKTSGYGYFPMLSFLRPAARQVKVEWLMDQYTEAKALYPKAKFHYVGHSHGTYMLAKALKDYPACRFHHVVFAGSVVHRDYKWERYIPGQVESVLNFVTTADWVVAIFPKAFPGRKDSGSRRRWA